MKILRNTLLDEMKKFSLSGHGVIIGRPGVGKSYALKGLRDILNEQNINCLYIPVEFLGDATETMMRERLEYEGTFIDELKKTKRKDGKNILILDGFDSARNEETRNNILWLIKKMVSELSEDWNVIVSVRVYDAKKSHKLLKVFNKNTSDVREQYYDPQIATRHFVVPELSEEEVRGVFSQIPNLAGLYDVGANEFKQLLKIPFNLWLIEKLLMNDGVAANLSSISSEVQLLDIFWEYRISRHEESEARELYLMKLTSELVKNKNLSARKDKVASIEYQKTWGSLLSEDILCDPIDSPAIYIAFYHNILFDYAVSVLIMPKDNNKLVEYLAEDLSGLIFLRPSLTYYFTDIWYKNNVKFWELFWLLANANNPYLKLISRLIFTAIILNEVNNVEQVEELVGKDEKKQVRDEAVRVLLQAFKALKIEQRDEGLDVWIQFLNKIVKNLNDRFIWDFTTVVSSVLDTSISRKDEVRISLLGEITRKLFEYIWHNQAGGRGEWLCNLGAALVVPMLIKTFKTNQVVSKKYLKQVLDTVGTPNFNIRYVYRLSDGINKIWRYDSDFVAEVYSKIFGHIETSEEATHMGGIVVSMTSNRRQDYEGCKYILKQQFPSYLKLFPLRGAKVAISIVSKYISRKHFATTKGINAKDDDTVTFPFGDKQCKYYSDNSYIWDDRYIDDPLELTKVLFDYAGKCASGGNTDKLEKLIDLFKKEFVFAYFWRNLLKRGIENPEMFSRYLFPLCLSKPIQLGHDTVYEVGEFIGKTAYLYYENGKLPEIETSILDITKAKEADEFFVRKRNRLLQCIPFDIITSKDAKSIVSGLKGNKEFENKPLATFESYSKPYTTDDWLEGQGVDLEKDDNKEMNKYFSAIEAFGDEFRNVVPPVEKINEIFLLMERLYAELKEREIDEAINTMALMKLGDTVLSFFRNREELKDEFMSFCRQILLECSYHRSPEPSEHDKNYNSPGYGNAPRNIAAQGICLLKLKEKDVEVLKTIKLLSSDQVPSVRYLLARSLICIKKDQEVLFWDIITERAKVETNNVVKLGFCLSLERTLITDEAKAIQCLGYLFNDTTIYEKNSDLLRRFISILLWFIFTKNHEWAHNKISIIVKDPILYSAAINCATSQVLTSIKPAKISSKEPKVKKEVEKALKWLDVFLSSAVEGIKKIRSLCGENQMGEKEQEKLKNIYNVIDNIVSRIYFSSGVRTELTRGEVVPVEEQREFYLKVKGVLSKILDFSMDKNYGVLFAPTAHYFMEFLNGVLKHEPKEVLSLAVRVARSSKPFNYNMDSLAIGETTKLVESIIADYRYDVKEGQSLNDLLDLLDIFAEAGWSEALNLIWRLDEIFR